MFPLFFSRHTAKRYLSFKEYFSLLWCLCSLPTQLVFTCFFIYLSFVWKLNSNQIQEISKKMWLVHTVIGSSKEVSQTIFVISFLLGLRLHIKDSRNHTTTVTCSFILCILKLFFHLICLNSHGYAIKFPFLFNFLWIHIRSVPQLQGQWHSGRFHWPSLQGPWWQGNPHIHWWLWSWERRRNHTVTRQGHWRI